MSQDIENTPIEPILLHFKVCLEFLFTNWVKFLNASLFQVCSRSFFNMYYFILVYLSVVLFCFSGYPRGYLDCLFIEVQLKTSL